VIIDVVRTKAPFLLPDIREREREGGRGSVYMQTIRELSPAVGAANPAVG